jgi:hypothetical protein
MFSGSGDERDIGLGFSGFDIGTLLDSRRPINKTQLAWSVCKLADGYARTAGSRKAAMTTVEKAPCRPDSIGNPGAAAVYRHSDRFDFPCGSNFRIASLSSILHCSSCRPALAIDTIDGNSRYFSFPPLADRA